jgi:hypothetical protein
VARDLMIAMEAAMRRELAMTGAALALIVAASGCRQNEKERAQRAQLRGQRDGLVREQEVVARLATPRQSGRIIYDTTPALSAENLARTHAPIVGLDKPLHASEPARHADPAAH